MSKLEEAKWRIEHLTALQESFPSFTNDFLPMFMAFMGFTTTEIQKEIAEFVEGGPRSLMVQACRSIAKSTIVLGFCVWSLIHNPDLRILIITAGQTLSKEMATGIIRTIMNWDILECLRPDVSAGDRTSVESFDVHHTLRTRENQTSPSVKCVGIGGSITGSRADLLIADDIEDPKNSQTAGGREILLTRSSEFSDVCVGRIIYLGTPQSIDSVYNSLPSRGFTVRIWPGRYPTEEQMSWYGDMLAPTIADKLQADPNLGRGGGLARDQGKATDTRIDESILQRKELEKGVADFQLQYMLNTRLRDAERYPLKTAQLVYDRLDGDLFPSELARDPRETGMRKMESSGNSFFVSSRMDVIKEGVDGTAKAQSFSKLSDKLFYIDPAGGGKISRDETAFACVGILNSNLYLTEIGGIPGGYDAERLEGLAKIVANNNPNRVVIEKNYGNGAFKEIFLPILRRYWQGEVSDHLAQGQKEIRINGILGPIMGRGALCITQKAIDSDAHYCAKYSAEQRRLYSVFFQMAKMTLDKDSLVHDDRLDALAGACAQYVPLLVVDQNTAAQKAKDAEFREWIKNPLGLRNQPKMAKGSLFNKYLR